MAEGVKSRFAGSASDSQPVEDWIKHIFPDYVLMKGDPSLVQKTKSSGALWAACWKCAARTSASTFPRQIVRTLPIVLGATSCPCHRLCSILSFCVVTLTCFHCKPSNSPWRTPVSAGFGFASYPPA